MPSAMPIYKVLPAGTRAEKIVELYDAIDDNGDEILSKTEVQLALRSSKTLSDMLGISQTLSRSDGSLAEFEHFWKVAITIYRP